MAGSDPFDDYFAQATGGKGNVSREPSKSSQGWMDYLYDAPSKITDWYKTTPWAGKPFGWVKGVNDAIDTGEKTLEPYIGKTGAKIASFPARVNSFGAEMFFGSPADLVGTASAIPTWGSSLAPTVGPKLLAKSPAIVAKTAPYLLKALNYAGRGSDALQSLYQGGEAVEAAKQGNYGTAAMQAGGSVLSGVGAADYIPFLGKPKADVPKPKETAIQELHRIAAEQRAARGNIAPPTWEDIGTKLDRLAAGGPADRKVVRESYTQKGTPTAITDESRLLTTGSEPLITRPRGGTGTAVIGKHPVNRAGDVDLNNVDYTSANLTERATRDFKALGIGETNDRVLRYLQDPLYREKVQLAVAQGKQTQTPRLIEHNVLEDFTRPIKKVEFTIDEKIALEKKVRDLEDEYFANLDGMDPDPEDINSWTARRLTAQEIDNIQDFGLGTREQAAEFRMRQAGLDPTGMDMTIDQPTNAQVPWDSPAGGYTGVVGEVRPGTPPTMKPSRTLYKRSPAKIDELAADSPNNTGYFPRTTHMAVEDKYVDEFGANLTTRELPEGEKIFDIKRGLSDEQIKEVVDHVTAKGVNLLPGELRVLQTETGPRLSSTLTDLMTRKHDIPEVKLPDALNAERTELIAKWNDARDDSSIDFTQPEKLRLDDLDKQLLALRVKAFRDSKDPLGFREFMKENGYFATNYKGISGAETIVGVAPQEGYAILDPSGLPRTKTVERGGTPPRVGGRMVDEQGNPIRTETQASRPVVAPEAKTPEDVRKKIMNIFKENKGKGQDVYQQGLRAGLTDAEIDLAEKAKVLSPNIASKLIAAGKTAPRISGESTVGKVMPWEQSNLEGAEELPDLVDESGTPLYLGKPLTKADQLTNAQGTPPPIANRPVLPQTGKWERGPTQTMVAPPNTTRPVVRTMDDVRQQMIANGVANPSDELVRKVFNDPRLLDKVVPPRSVSEGVSAEGKHVFAGETVEEGVKPLAGLLNSANPEDIRFRKALEDKSNEFLKLIHHTDEIGTKLNKAKEIIGDSEFGAIIDRVKTTQDGWAKKFVKGMGMSMETELERMGPGGKAVAHLFKLAATDAPIRFNNYMKGIDVDLRKMKHVDFEKVVDSLEGKKVELTPELENFKTRLEGILKVSGTEMEEHGLLEKGLRANYFPHRYDGVPTETLRQKMRADGMTEDQVSKALADIQEHRELKTSGEFSRNDLNIPGYRKDKQVLIDHLRETAKRVEHAKRFGAKDIADPESQLSRFVRASENPQRAKDLSDRILRGGRQVSPESMMASKAIRNYATAAHLSLASISQLGGAVPIAMRTSMKETLMGLGKALREDPNSKFMKNVNYARDFATHWNDGAKGDMLYKAFGIQGVQNYMNKVAGQAGYAHAQTLFTGLQKDPTNKLARKQLEDLTLTPIAEVLKQPQLTEHQLQRAMTRMAEISQGTADAKNLPYHWVGNGTRLIPQIFQRMAFQGTKAIKDGLMEGDMTNRLKKLGVLGITGMVAGEVIGDVKEIPKTAAEVGTNTISQALGYTTDNKDLFTTDWANNEYLQNIGLQPDEDNDRFGYTRKMVGQVSPEAGKDENIVRGISNLMNSYAMGMPGDMLLQVSEAMNDRRPLNAMASGFWAWDELNTVADQGVNLAKGNVRDPLRQVVRRFPVVGSGIVREIDTDFQAGGGGAGSKPIIKSGAW